jgi:DDE superfamily endonuclease
MCDDPDISWRFAYSPNGWTDGKIGLQWMMKDFDAQTKEKADGRTRVLLLDGHSSHYTLGILEYPRPPGA